MNNNERIEKLNLEYAIDLAQSNLPRRLECYVREEFIPALVKSYMEGSEFELPPLYWDDEEALYNIVEEAKSTVEHEEKIRQARAS